MPHDPDLLGILEDAATGQKTAAYEFTRERIEQIRENWLKARSSKTELLLRLNRRLKGQNPGAPVNWRGL